MEVLVAYATTYGSTRGVAERIAKRLQRRGIAVDARPMADGVVAVRYDAFVLGSAIHAGKWLPEGRRFLDRNAAVLRERPVWLFSVSTLGDEDSMFAPSAARLLRGLRKETPEIGAFRTAIAPRAHRNFAGAIARSHWPASGRVLFRVMGGSYGDHRNWPAIDAWSDSIAASAVADWADPAGRAIGETTADTCRSAEVLVPHES